MVDLQSIFFDDDIYDTNIYTVVSLMLTELKLCKSLHKGYIMSHTNFVIIIVFKDSFYYYLEKKCLNWFVEYV